MRAKLNIFDVILFVFMVLIIYIMLYPLIHVIALSFSHPSSIIKGQISLMPKNFTLIGYELIAKSQDVGRAYSNTIVYTILSSLLVLFISSITAYPLSVKHFLHGSLFQFL